jgi:hypothetical protein
MIGWQPINTAPKDGTHVLLISKVNTQWVGSWRLPRLGEPQNQSYYEYEWRDGGGRWSTPTHWRPLPNPPAANEGD